MTPSFGIGLACDQAYFSINRARKGTPDTLTSRLPVVQNLDFTLIGQKTIDLLQPRSDWSQNCQSYLNRNDDALFTAAAAAASISDFFKNL